MSLPPVTSSTLSPPPLPARCAGVDGLCVTRVLVPLSRAPFRRRVAPALWPRCYAVLFFPSSLSLIPAGCVRLAQAAVLPSQEDVLVPPFFPAPPAKGALSFFSLSRSFLVTKRLVALCSFDVFGFVSFSYQPGRADMTPHHHHPQPSRSALRSARAAHVRRYHHPSGLRPAVATALSSLSVLARDSVFRRPCRFFNAPPD